MYCLLVYCIVLYWIVFIINETIRYDTIRYTMKQIDFMLCRINVRSFCVYNSFVFGKKHTKMEAVHSVLYHSMHFILLERDTQKTHTRKTKNQSEKVQNHIHTRTHFRIMPCLSPRNPVPQHQEHSKRFVSL